MTSTSSSNSSEKNLVVDPFCFRQFSEHEASEAYGGTVFKISVSELEEIANSKYSSDLLKDGYAPFCKHLFIENDFEGGNDVRVNVLPAQGNEHLIRTSYAARNEKELPVLQRFIPMGAVKETDLPVAKYFDLILYSREQIRKENESMGKPPGDEVTAPWGIVSIKAQMEDYELPMNPITQMRNALGKDQGGSGLPLEREAYMKSVRYWEANVVVS
eukprot:CAMPEP_0113452006 /NCGR_PEP_ID=MMETSP0014_2-20120614/6627_1 /TAXON_ID=2857 /ORGANISM="Nitzschia sp." /LENGTH=215 /DNA_ID=CAMNT_0000343371 /DNA_START=174 /DNA_END=821 /DNA_ORIENTATION=- /assembly_acc=CAM_ASM_000159